MATGFECKKCGDDMIIEHFGNDDYYPTFCPTCGERLPTQDQVEQELDAKYITTPNESVINRDDTSTLCQTCKGYGCSDCDNLGIWFPKEGLKVCSARRR